jgi:predicted nucleotidyltransferase
MNRVADQLHQYFTAYPQPGLAAAYLFGSHARGAPHAESDVDVALVMDPATVTGALHRARLAERIGTEIISVLHINAVDVVCLNDAPPELAVAILRRGQRLFCSNPELDHAVTRTALLRHGDLAPFLARNRRLKLAAIAP